MLNRMKNFFFKAKARRLLWNDILSLIKEKRIVILTSHSMEECEALCTRLVIMVNGEFKCLGSTQHLKAKFGNGYKLSIRLNNVNNKDRLFEFIRKKFTASINTEAHKNLYEFILPFSSTKLSKMFGTIEKNREMLDILDYSVTQTTLDQIFVNFAKAQKEEGFEDEELQEETGINSQTHEINNNSEFEMEPVITNENKINEQAEREHENSMIEKMSVDEDVINQNLEKISKQDMSNTLVFNQTDQG